jgi:hypothetical protein
MMQYNKLKTNLSPQQWVDSLSKPESVLNIDFINQNLEELPDLTRFTKLRVLLAGNNCLKELPSMCKSVELISLYNNAYTEIPYVDANVKELILSGNKIVDAMIPDKLESIDLSSNPLINIKFTSKFRGGIVKYLGNLKKFYINNTPIQKIINKIPKNIVEKWYDMITPFNSISLNNQRFKIKNKRNYHDDHVSIETLEICIRIKIWNTMMMYYFGRNVSKSFLASKLWKSIENKAKEKYAPNKLLELLNNLGEDCTQEEFDLALASW